MFAPPRLRPSSPRRLLALAPCGLTCLPWALAAASLIARGQGLSGPSAPAAHEQAAPAIVQPYPAGSGTDLSRRISALLAEPEARRAHWGIAVTTLDGVPLYGLDEGKLFRPASNTKLFTTAAAMQILGGSTQVETRVAGLVDLAHLGADGMLQGDLLLVGQGDANLSARTIPYISPAARQEQERQQRAQGLEPVALSPLVKIEALAGDLVGHGLKHVTGDVVGDDTLWPWEPYIGDWSLDDAMDGDGPPVSALTVIDNVLAVNVAPGLKPGDPATITLVPDLGYYTIVGSVSTVKERSEAHLRIDHDLNTRRVRVLGTVAAGAPYINEVAIDDPAEFAALALKRALETQGVQVDGKAVARHRPSLSGLGYLAESRSTTPPLSSRPATPPCSVNLSCEGFQGQTLATLRSPTLLEDVTVTLKVSQNLHAELLLRRLGKALGTEGTAAQGSRVVRRFLLEAGVDGDDFSLYDGSGLSGHNLVTPRAIARLLTYAARQPWFASWKAALPIAGVDGSLLTRFPAAPLKSRVFAKTGTLGESRALSGYLEGASGHTVIFSIMVDNHTPASNADRATMDEIVGAIQAVE